MVEEYVYTITTVPYYDYVYVELVVEAYVCCTAAPPPPCAASASASACMGGTTGSERPCMHDAADERASYSYSVQPPRCRVQCPRVAARAPHDRGTAPAHRGAATRGSGHEGRGSLLPPCTRVPARGARRVTRPTSRFSTLYPAGRGARPWVWGVDLSSPSAPVAPPWSRQRLPARAGLVSCAAADVVAAFEPDITHVRAWHDGHTCPCQGPWPASGQ